MMHPDLGEQIATQETKSPKDALPGISARALAIGEKLRIVGEYRQIDYQTGDHYELVAQTDLDDESVRFSRLSESTWHNRDSAMLYIRAADYSDPYFVEVEGEAQAEVRYDNCEVTDVSVHWTGYTNGDAMTIFFERRGLRCAIEATLKGEEVLHSMVYEGGSPFNHHYNARHRSVSVDDIAWIEAALTLAEEVVER